MLKDIIRAMKISLKGLHHHIDIEYFQSLFTQVVLGLLSTPSQSHRWELWCPVQGPSGPSLKLEEIDINSILLSATMNACFLVAPLVTPVLLVQTISMEPGRGGLFVMWSASPQSNKWGGGMRLLL